MLTREVARVARNLLSDNQWVEAKILKREDARQKHNAKFPDRQREERMVIEVDVNLVDRGCVKTQVMVTGYGGTYLSKREYIIKALEGEVL